MPEKVTSNLDEKKAFYKALKEFQRDVPTIAKNKTAKIVMTKGGSFEYKYADLSDIRDTIKPILAKHGLSYMQMPTTQNAVPALKTIIAHEDGYSTYETMQLPVQSGATAQLIGSAITYMRRYALSAALGLVTEDDIDAQDQAPPSVSQKQELWALVTKAYGETNNGETPSKSQMFDYILELSGKRVVDLYASDVERLIEELKN